MTFRKMFVLGAAIASLGVAAGAALAQTPQQKALIDVAKVQGVVGEQADGYVGFRTPTSDAALQAAVSTTNAARREAYASRAAEAGTTTDVAASRMFETQLLPRIASGQWYRDASGRWVQR